MSRFRGLPPVLRVASLLRPLFPLGLVATVAYLLTTRVWSSAQVGVYVSRVAIIAVNLSLVGLGGSLVVRAYRARVRQPGGGPLQLESWQSQVRTMVALTGVPVCVLVLTVIISPTIGAYQIVFPVSIIGAFVFLAVALSMGIVREARG